MDATGVTRDAIDRVTTTYSSSPAAGAQPLQTFSNTYDGSPAFLGWLTGFSDSLGHTGTVAYDGAGRVAAAQYNDGTPAKTYGYTWNGELAAASSGLLGTENYTYDAAGRLATASEPNKSSAYTSPAKVTYNRYNDGTTKSLGVSSPALNVLNLFLYSRRVDGLLSKEFVNYPADGRAQQTFSWTYSPAGRFVSSADDLKSPSSTIKYDGNGRVGNYTIPAGVGSWLPPGDPTMGYNLAHPDDRGIMPVQIARTDGFTDRHNVFQGSRVYDYEADQWASPDAASGSLDNPFSFRRYLYDNANANSNSDPSGNAPCPGGVPAGDIGCVANNPTFNNGTNYDNNNIVGEIIGGIVGFFAGLFGGHGHSGGPAVPPQVEPADPETYATFSRAANLANPLGAAIFGIPQILVPELGGIEAVAAGLGGEVAGAAAVETGDGIYSYAVGRYSQLKSISEVGDGLDIHHVIQASPASQIIADYARSAGASIALPAAEHATVPRLSGQFSGSARSLLARDISNLRTFTNAPNSALQQLIDLNKQLFPGSFLK